MKTVGVFGFACLCAGMASSATMLFDFEGAEGKQSFEKSNHSGLTLSQANGISATGKSSLKITTPKWKEGLQRWPAVNLKPAVHDWSAYDRIAITLMNPDPATFHLGTFIIGDNKRVQDGLHYSFNVPSSGHQQCVIPLDFPEKVNKKDIRTIHLFFSDAEQDITVYIDSIALLKKGEQPPEQPAVISFLSSLVGPSKKNAYAKLEKIQKELLDTSRTEAEKKLVKDLAARVSKGIEAAELPFREERTIENYDQFNTALHTLACRLEWYRSFHAFLAKSTEQKLPIDLPILFGEAPPYRHVLPQGNFLADPVGKLSIDLAKNEKEAKQLIVLPNRNTPIEGLSLTVSDLKGKGGSVLSAKQVDCDLLGYVKTKAPPPYDRMGKPQWWPDPILDFIPTFTLQPESTQSYWIRVRAPKGQAAGIYQGTLTLQAKGIATQTLPIEVRVRDFTLPDKSPLPLAITFSPGHHPQPETRQQQNEWKKSPNYPVNIWKTKKIEWVDFLADYWISYDSLYHGGNIDFDLLKHLDKQGRLGMFNLRYWHYFKNDEANRKSWKNSILATIRKNYLRAKELGILDHAYIYGCDEIKKEFFPQIREATDLIREACPGVPIMTTAYDKSYGLDSPLGTMDAFCPLTPSYDPVQAQKAREAGKQVWWYICCGPHHPHANIFIEYPPIESRLLMGAMTAKMRPDGFLYYQISIWNSRNPISKGPYTDWDPRSWTTYHGDGSWTCVGPGGKPVPTQRLENFHDGLEDYAYVLELERRYTLAPQEAVVWRAKARAAINVPDTLVTDMKTYSHDECKLAAWRKNLADLIESAPIAPAIR